MNKYESANNYSYLKVRTGCTTIFVGGFFLISLILLYWGATLLVFGERTNATILRFEDSNSRVYQGIGFVTNSGETIRTTFTFEGILTTFSEGEIIPIIYDPSRPRQKVDVDDYKNLILGPLIFFIIKT